MPLKWQAHYRQVDQIIPQLQEIIGVIRNLRNEHKVDLKRIVSVSIKSTTDLTSAIESNREVIQILATCNLKSIDANLAPIPNAAKTSAAGCDIFIEDLVDQAAEQQRIAKRCEELKKSIAALKGRLSNESYISKAPPTWFNKPKTNSPPPKKNSHPSVVHSWKRNIHRGNAEIAEKNMN